MPVSLLSLARVISGRILCRISAGVFTPLGLPTTTEGLGLLVVTVDAILPLPDPTPSLVVLVWFFFLRLLISLASNSALLSMAGPH